MVNVMNESFDVVIVGAGIVGLAHAYEASKRGLSVAVVERNASCTGASVRNFGFITVTGQGAGDTWRRAMHTRNEWASIAPQAGIAIEHTGLWLLAKHPQSLPVLEAFMKTNMAQDCSLHTAQATAKRAPYLRADVAKAALFSPHEIRVESKTAIPAFTQWLQKAHAVRFFWNEAVLGISNDEVATPKRTLRTARTVVCTGAAITGLSQPALSKDSLHLTQLQMLRVMPQLGFKLASAVMSDLSLVRYKGYSALPEAAALEQYFQTAQAPSLSHGVHLIAVQSADGSLVIGDSHHYANNPEPFSIESVDDLIIRHALETLKLSECKVLSRWTGIYPTGSSHDCLIRSPNPRTKVVVVTSGTGASTAFGIAHDVFTEWV